MGRATRPSPIKDMRVLRSGAIVPDGAERLDTGARRLEWSLGWRSLVRGDFSFGTVPDADEWTGAAERLAAFTMATDPHRLSVDDYMSFVDGEDRTVENGLGRLIADWGKNIPARLKHAADRIAWDDGGAVTVSGPWGSVKGRAVIVTVPTGVLRDGRIHFVPELPDRTLAAIEALPMGRFMKIGLRLESRLRDVPEYAFDISRANRGQAVGFHVHPSLPLITAIVAGDHARDVARMPGRDRIAHVTDACREAFGAAHPAIVAHDHYD